MSQITKITKELEERFPGVEARFTKVRQVIDIPVFSVRMANEGSLRNYWDRISSLLAAKYQSSLDAEHEFERWNIYVFYICDAEISQSLLGKIENDKFATRKIVVFDPQRTLTISKLVQRYITGEEILADINGVNGQVAVPTGDGDQPGFMDSELARLINGKFVTGRYRKKEKDLLQEVLGRLEEHIGL